MNNFFFFFKSRGGVVDSRDSDGRTPFYVTCDLGRWASARSLLDLECDVSIADDGGDAPIFRVIMHKSEPGMEILKKIIQKNPEEVKNFFFFNPKNFFFFFQPENFFFFF